MQGTSESALFVARHQIYSVISIVLVDLIFAVDQFYVPSLLVMEYQFPMTEHLIEEAPIVCSLKTLKLPDHNPHLRLDGRVNFA